MLVWLSFKLPGQAGADKYVIKKKSLKGNRKEKTFSKFVTRYTRKKYVGK